MELLGSYTEDCALGVLLLSVRPTDFSRLCQAPQWRSDLCLFWSHAEDLHVSNVFCCCYHHHSGVLLIVLVRAWC